jgi:methylenetetrahydrofolate reductase (NADPH)
MQIKNVFSQKKPVLSFEVFPPKPEYPLETVFDTVRGLRDLKPDYISVTYGAGGSNRARTVAVATRIKRDYHVESMAHLTCVGHSLQELETVIAALQANGIENILALRGDPPQNDPGFLNRPGHFVHAAELVDHLRRHGNFCIGAAAYPEGHGESRRVDADWRYLRDKVAAGVDFLVTQLFFDNRCFYHFQENLLRLGVNVPVTAGIMPVVNSKQIRRMVSLSGAAVPAKLLQLLERYADDPVGLEQAGIEYAVTQINDLIANGVAGIHLYTMNRIEQARIIVANIGYK